MSADGTLDLIDGALRDYELSSDAMRWQPDRAACDGTGYTRGGASRTEGRIGLQGMTASLVIYDEVTTFTAAVGDAGNAYLQAVGPAVRSFVGAFQSVTEAIVVKIGHDFHRAYYPRQHVRCRECHPIANPRPLAISGAKYRRKQKARRRR